MKDLLSFDSMITPKIITFVYFLLLIGVSVASIGAIASGNILSGLAVLFGGFVASRVWCELMIVVFKINENIQKIADKSDTRTDLSI